MINKLKILIIFFMIGSMAILISCNKEDDDEATAKPEICNFELGTDNNKTGILGSDLHVEAEVLAVAKINDITVEIHMEDGDGWEYDSTFTEFAGLKNTTFHKHIDISAEADTGDYHFHFIVTDMEGQQTTYEEELKIQEPDDDVPPEITISDAPTNNQVFSNGETITISGFVSDDTYLGGIYIGLVREDQNLTDAEVNATNTITILHNHTFNDPTSYDFSSSIVVGAEYDNNIEPKKITGDIAWQSANYYILVKCKDAFGGNWTFSDHYPIVINY